MNSRINLCIDEYVRLKRDREILRKHWFEGMSFKELSNEYNLTVEAMKRIIYGIGDAILLRASK